MNTKLSNLKSSRYKIVSYTHQDRTLYFIKKRINWMSWDWITDETTVGPEKLPITYRAGFYNIEDAIARVDQDRKTDEFNKKTFKVVKLIYDKNNKTQCK